MWVRDVIYTAQIYNPMNLAYTRMFNIQYDTKDVYRHNSKQHISSCLALGNGAHTTMPEEGERCVMSNTITQWVNKPHNSNKIKMKSIEHD